MSNRDKAQSSNFRMQFSPFLSVYSFSSERLFSVFIRAITRFSMKIQER